MGEIAKEILLAFAERTNDKGIERIRGFNTFQALDRIVIEDISVTPLLVDHSAFDAYMFLIEGDGKRILHTGDFRVHGFRGKAVFPTIRKYVGTVDLLITEGTALSRDSDTLLEEAELQTLANHVLSENKYVFVLCASTNIDRIAAFYHATPRGKYFICDEYQKRILDIVTKHAKDKTPLYNFQKVLTYGSNLDERLRERGFCMLVRCSEYFDRIMRQYPDATFLFSMWEGYRKGKNRSKSISDFTANFDFQPFHTSGHASTAVIQAVCETVKPRIGVIPIHSDAPKGMDALGLDCQIIYLADGQELSLS
ncbi:MAG: MBL fold metallo-hydrolase [Lentisphaerae bacterium]|nr:MBL fold metallo-hydrolase [Lentisphaerota bacterium]NLV50773.1 MBL fold metallo-hydrolase [Clostridiales bacterium]